MRGFSCIANKSSRLVDPANNIRAISRLFSAAPSPFSAEDGGLPPFHTRSTGEILGATTIFEACSKKWLMKPVINMLKVRMVGAIYITSLVVLPRCLTLCGGFFSKASFDLESAPPKAHKNAVTIPLHWVVRNTGVCAGFYNLAYVFLLFRSCSFQTFLRW